MKLLELTSYALGRSFSALDLIVTGPESPSNRDEKHFIAIHEPPMSHQNMEFQYPNIGTHAAAPRHASANMTNDTSQEEKIVVEDRSSDGLGPGQLDGHMSLESLPAIPRYSPNPYEALEPWEIFSMDYPPPVPNYMIRNIQEATFAPGRQGSYWQGQNNIYEGGHRTPPYQSQSRPYTPRREYSPFVNQTPRRYSPDTPYGNRKVLSSLPDLYASRMSTPVSQSSFQPASLRGASPFVSHSSGSLDLLSNSLVPSVGQTNRRGGSPAHHARSMSTDMLGVPLDAPQSSLRRMRNNILQGRKRNPRMGSGDINGGIPFAMLYPGAPRRGVSGPAGMDGPFPGRASSHQYAQSNIESRSRAQQQHHQHQQPRRYRPRPQYPPSHSHRPHAPSGSFDGSYDRVSIPSRPNTAGGGNESRGADSSSQYVNLVTREGPDYYVPFKPQINYRKPSPISPILAARYLRRPQPPSPVERPRGPEWDFQFQSPPELELQNPIKLDALNDDHASITSPPPGINRITSTSSGRRSTSGKDFRKSLSVLSGFVPSVKRTGSINSNKSSKRSRKSLDLSGTCELRDDLPTPGPKATLKKRLQQELNTYNPISRKSMEQEKRAEFQEVHTATSVAGPSAGDFEDDPHDTSFQTVDLDPSHHVLPPAQGPPASSSQEAKSSSVFSNMFKKLPWLAKHTPSSVSKAQKESGRATSSSPNKKDTKPDDGAGRCVGWWVQEGGGEQRQAPVAPEPENASEGSASPPPPTPAKGRFGELKAFLGNRRPVKAMRKISSHVSADLRIITSRRSSLRDGTLSRSLFKKHKTTTE